MKEHLEYLLTGNPPPKSKKKKTDRCLIDVKWKGTTNTVHWEIKPTKDFIPDMNVKDNFKILQTTSSLTNMVVLDENDFPRKYTCPEDLLKDFCIMRYTMYTKRKNYWLSTYQKDLQKESNRYKFVKAVIDKKLNMYQEDEDLEQDMIGLKLTKVDETFDYLLSMQMRSMTKKRLEEIQKEIDKIQIKISELKNQTESDLWNDDLDRFLVAYQTFLKTRKEEVIRTKSVKTTPVGTSSTGKPVKTSTSKKR